MLRHPSLLLCFLPLVQFTQFPEQLCPQHLILLSVDAQTKGFQVGSFFRRDSATFPIELFASMLSDDRFT